VHLVAPAVDPLRPAELHLGRLPEQHRQIARELDVEEAAREADGRDVDRLLGHRRDPDRERRCARAEVAAPRAAP
jgi:hypothetical protein